MYRPAVVLAFLLVACSSTSPRSGPRQLPPSQLQCDFVNYHHDEGVNDLGPGACSTDCDCDGVRSCSGGMCTGQARPDPGDINACRDPGYKWNENWNGGGPGVCATDCECSGIRRCVSGHCEPGATPPTNAARAR